MSFKNFRHKWIFGVLLAAVLLVLCFYDLDFGLLWKTIKQVRFTYIFIALFLGMVKVFVLSLRWKIIIDQRKVISISRIYSLFAVSQLMNISLPALTGQAARVVFLNKTENLPKTFGATTVLVEATFDGLCLILMLLISSFFIVFPSWMTRNSLILGIIMAGLISVYILILANQRGLRYYGKKKLRRRFPRFYRRIEGVSRSFTQGLSALTSFKHTLLVFAYSVLMWACNIIIVMLLIAAFREAFGLQVPYWMAMVFVAVTTFFTVIPITPGNLGTFQWIVIGIIKQTYGVIPKEVAVGFSIIFHFMNLLPIWITGLFFLFKDHFGIGVKEISKESLEEDIKREKEEAQLGSAVEVENESAPDFKTHHKD